MTPSKSAPAEPPTSATTADRDAASRVLASAIVVVAGWVLILAFHNWRYSAATLFLMIAWLAVYLTAYWVWTAAWTAASEGIGDEMASVSAGVYRSELEREKRLLLKAIKEVEFDLAMGKLSDDDAASFTRVYRARAIEIIRELSLAPGSDDRDVAAMIERELAARLGDAGATAEPSAKEEPSAEATSNPDAGADAESAEPEPAAVASAEPAAAREVVVPVAIAPAADSGACASCGTGNDADAVFCKKCGARLGDAPEAEA